MQTQKTEFAALTFLPTSTKKKKLQDSALPVSWEVYYLELCEKRQRRRFAGKCIRTLESLIAY